MSFADGFQKTSAGWESLGRDIRDSDKYYNYDKENNDITLQGARRGNARAQAVYDDDLAEADRIKGLKGPSATPAPTVQPVDTKVDGPASMGGPGATGTSGAGAAGLKPPATAATPNQGAPANPFDDQIAQAQAAMRRAKLLGNQQEYEKASQTLGQAQYSRMHEEGVRLADQMSPDELHAYLLRESDNDGHPLSVMPIPGSDAKGGPASTQYLARIKGHQPVILSRSEVLQLVGHEYAGKNGYASQAAQAAGAIMKTLRGENVETMGKQATAAAALENADSQRNISLAHSAYWQQARRQGKIGQPIQMVDPKTKEAVVAVPVMGEDGTMSFRRADTGGLMFQKQVDPKAIEARAAALVGKPTGRTVNGKPEMYDDTSAYQAAFQQMVNADSMPSGGLAPVPAPPRGGAPSKATKPSDAPPGRQISTITPPRTADEARRQMGLQPPPARMSDDELFIRGMGVQQ